MKMKVDVIARETIKPSSPTPHHLRHFNLSLLDQLSPPYYSPLLLFYATTSTLGSSVPDSGDKAAAADQRSQRLKESLSEALTCFYPLAGRLKDNRSIDCNDDGADYLEARVNCPLSDVLEQPKMEELRHLIPGKPTEWWTGPLLLIQASFFQCGGMSLGLSSCHKLTDGATFGAFTKGWAASTALGSPHAVVPDFTSASLLLPPRDHFPIMPITFQDVRLNGIARRFVFDASKITGLKAKAASLSVQQPTRVEAVSALIWKCAATASRSRLKSPRPSVLAWAVNIRARLVPPLREHSFGNIIGKLLVRVDGGDSEMNLSGLVYLLRKGIEEFDNNYVKKLQGEEHLSAIEDLLMEVRNVQIRGDEIDLYTHTSWSRFPMYEADFGWGKPTWVSIGRFGVPNTVILMEGREGDGIEAWVSLIEEDMVLFERDQELLTFAKLNPSAL